MTRVGIGFVLVVAAAIAVVGSRVRADQTRDTRPTRGTSALGGVVVADRADARAVRRAVVTIRPDDGGLTRQTTTDDAGRFLIADLPAGRFTITVSKPGWVTTYYGSRRVGGGPGLSIALGENERQTVLRVPLVPGGVIAGRVLDQNGQPLMEQMPVLLTLRTFGPQRVLVSTGAFTLPGLSTTDDLGEFRFFGLAPGTYYVAVRPTIATTGAVQTTAEAVRWALQNPAATGAPAPPRVAMVSSVPTYFPGTIDPGSASAITIGPGEERADLDIMLRLQPVLRVTGVATLSNGSPAARASVTMGPDQPIASSLDPEMYATADAEGRFRFPSVRPGTYRLRARASTQAVAPARSSPGATGPAPVLDQWASQIVSVTGDVENLAVPLTPASVVNGRVVFERTVLDPPTDLRNVRIQLIESSYALMMVGATGRSSSRVNFAMGAAEPDGTFAIQGVAPARYQVMSLGTPLAPPGAGANWTLQSVTLGGRDIWDEGIEIAPHQNVDGLVLTYTDRETSLSGRLVDASDRAASGHFVFLFSADRRFWTPLSLRNLQPARPSSDGRYSLTGLRPGDYYLVALTEYEEDDLTDPAFLELLVPAAIRITLGEGEKMVQDLRLGGGV